MEMDVSLNGMERCLIGEEIFELPQELLEYENVFKEVLSKDTWTKSLTEQQRAHLTRFLPSFPENDEEEKEETVKRLLTGENFKFGNPFLQYHRKMKSGLLSPDIAHYFALCQGEKEKEYHYQQQKYYTTLLKDLLESRPYYIAAIKQSSPGQPIRVNKPVKSKTEVDYKTREMERRTKRKYKNILKEVREECCELETSSEDSGSESDDRVLYSAVVTGPDPCTVVSTLTPAAYGNGDMDSAQRPEVFRVTHEDYYNMLMRHKRRKARYPNAPEFQTKGLKFEDVINHVYPPKDGVKKEEVKEEPMSDSQPPPRKRAKERRHSKDGKPKKKLKESGSGPPSMAGPDVTVIKKEDGNASLEDELVDVETEDVPCSRNLPRYASFFSLIRDTIKESDDQKITTAKLEETVKSWQSNAHSGLNPWFSLHESWPENVNSALKYLAGDMIGMSEDFIPFVDYKERFQVWQWIGDGRDKDAALTAVFKQWLEGQNVEGNDLYSDQQMSPPPPRCVTDYVVKPTSDEEKIVFRQQEKFRFENPHKAFTYRLHGYESVVGPVKGIYSKETSLKVREHSILIKERPAYVTILTLVRDSCARLPNGEGTRADICMLMRDSMYISDGIEDVQLNTVVSGALDRLHYEKDPCIKYDVGRKIWIYLHRGRVEEDFEKIHHAQEKAAKAKRSLTKTKVSRSNPSKQNLEKMKLKDAAVQLKKAEPSKPAVTTAVETALPDSALHAASSAASSAVSSAVGSASPALSKSMTLPPGALQQKMPLNRSSSAPKSGPNSVAGLLQKARQMPNQSPRPLPAQPDFKPAPQTIKQLTSNQPPPALGQSFTATQPLTQRLIMGQTAPMAVFLPTTQPGQQQLTFSLIPAKVPDQPGAKPPEPTSSTSEATSSSVPPKISTPPMMPISRIMQQLTKSVVNVSDLIASQTTQKKPRKRTKKPSPSQQQQLGNMLLSTSQRVQQAQMAAPKLRASDLASMSRASPSVSTISQILQSTAAIQSTSQTTHPAPSTTPVSNTDSPLVAVVSSQKPLDALPLANTFIPIAPAEIASTAGGAPQQASMSAPVAIAPAQSTAVSVPVALAPAMVTKAGGTPTTMALGHLAANTVLTAGLQTSDPQRLPAPVSSSPGIVAATLPAQIIVQATAPPPSRAAAPGTRIVAPQSLVSATGPQPNQLQLVKTVLSQSTGQTSPTAAFLITTTPSAAAGQKLTGKNPAKPQSVYARIITPPPGIRLNVATATAGGTTAVPVVGAPATQTNAVRNLVSATNVLTSTVVSAIQQRPLMVSAQPPLQPQLVKPAIPTAQAARSALGRDSPQSGAHVVAQELSPKAALAAAIRGRTQLGVLPTVAGDVDKTEEDKTS